MRKSFTFLYSCFWLPPSLQPLRKLPRWSRRRAKKARWFGITSLALPSSTAIAHYFQNKLKASRWKCTAMAHSVCCKDSCRKRRRE